MRDKQEQQLLNLVRTAQHTLFGKKHNFSNIRCYEKFQEKVSLSFYADITDRIEELKKGKKNVLWPGGVTKFAVSAGTSSAGKHLPLTSNRLQSDRRFMRKIVWSYLKQRPNFFRLLGTHISLPGSIDQASDSEIGEISAFTAQQVPWWLAPFQLMNTKELVHLPFDKKIEQIIERSRNKDIRVISAAPSWLLTIFQSLLAESNSDSIASIWPNLTLLVCGGVKLANYRPHLEKLLEKPDVDFIETYGASEGYFSFTDDLQSDDMKLVVDNGIFYEFIPDPLPDKDSLAIQEAVPIWEVEPDKPYAMIVSTDAGLWRYALNDIIQFTQTNPPRIKVMGRVSEMLDEYGEALYAFEAEQALREATDLIELETGAFTIAASLDNEKSIPRHLWFVQTYDSIHSETLGRLGQKLDALLKSKNRHYAIRRESGALGMPKVHTIDQQQINYWLELKGKQKAQGKLPAILKNSEDVQFFR